MLANQISEQCDPESHWWGLEWNTQFFDFDSMSAKEEQQIYMNSEILFYVTHTHLRRFCALFLKTQRIVFMACLQPKHHIKPFQCRGITEKQRWHP
jgi:hypothetical protein